MNPLYDIERTIECCAACGEELVQNAGRYIFYDNSYCMTCWREDDARMNLRRGTITRNIANKTESNIIVYRRKE